MAHEWFAPVTGFALLGVVAGLVLLWRGMLGERRAARLGDTSTSTVASMAAGEVRISGIVEPAELTLTSPLQSRTCVYYRSKVEQDEGRYQRTLLNEERAVGFRVRDPSGSVRVFPRSAAWLVPLAFNDHQGLLGDEPTGLDLREGGAIHAEFADRAAQVAELLTVHQPDPIDDTTGRLNASGSATGLLGGGRRHYQEARIEPGQPVTIVGMAIPFGQLPDPSGSDAASGPESGGLDATGGIADPEVAADLAAARAAGMLETDPQQAWGNAAIPGFGIGRPTTAPELDPGAHALPLATAAEAQHAAQTFDIAPETLVVAATPDVRLLVSLGPPGVAVAREQTRFLVGLLGAILAIASAVVLAVTLSGGFGS